MDIWVAVASQNAQRLVQVLAEFGFGSTGLAEDIFMRENKVIRMGNPPFRIEILTGISGVGFAECYAHRITDIIDDVQVNLIDLDRLKQNKRASGRYKDLNDLEHLP
jgi:hypothetical protein